MKDETEVTIEYEDNEEIHVIRGMATEPMDKEKFLLAVLSYIEDELFGERQEQ